MAKASKSGRDVPTTFEIDVAETAFDATDQHAQGLADLIEEFQSRIAAMTPTEREAYDAKCRAEEIEADRRALETTQRLEEAQAALIDRHHAIQRDRSNGVVGTQTEIGKPFGLTAVAVGRVLDAHGLRERVDVVEGDGMGGSATLHYLRGVVDGFAVHDSYDGREYWIVSRVAPLLAPHAKARR